MVASSEVNSSWVQFYIHQIWEGDVVLNSRSDEPHERLQLLYHYYSTIKLSHYYTVLLGFSDKTHRFNS